MEENRVLKFNIPLSLLPSVFPPGAGERKWATGFMNWALVGTGEKGEWVMMTPPFFGGDIDGNGWALAFKWKMIDRWDIGDQWGFKIGGGRREGDDIRAMGVELMRNANAVWSNDFGEATESVGEFVGILEAPRKKLMLGVTRESWNEFKVEFFDGCGGFEGFQMRVEGSEEDIRRESGV